MITIIDYGMGNMGSIQNMLARTGHKSEVTSDVKTIEKATKLILPGVGAFDSGMEHLAQSGLLKVLEKRVLEDKVPILGICLGVQLLFETSEEGDLTGLGWISGKVKKFQQPNDDSKLRIPHMGWNKVMVRREGMLSNMETEPRFYFVHSYHITDCPEEYIVGESVYGEKFTCAVQKDHIWGAQFHPEKSHRYGIQLLSNFASL